jgi:hypothetical protein
VQELGISPEQLGDRGDWLIIRDIPHALEYLRPARDIVASGLAWELGAFKYHVLSGFRPVTATHDRPYNRLALSLAGEGVPDIEKAVRELYFAPVHAPLRAACSKGHVEYLTAQLDSPSDLAARNALLERLGHVADGLGWMFSQRTGHSVAVNREPALHAAGSRYAALHAVARKAADTGSPETGTVLHVDLLLALIQVEAVLDLLQEAEPAMEAARSQATTAELERASAPTLIETEAASTVATEKAGAGIAAHESVTEVDLPGPVVNAPSSEVLPAASDAAATTTATGITPAMWPKREALLAEWELATPVVEGFETMVDANEARRRAALVNLTATLPTGPIAAAIRLALGTKRGQTFMDVHESEGTLWLNKERFEELARFLAEREEASGRATHAAAAADADALAQLAEREGYRAERIAAELGPAPKIDAPDERRPLPLQG